MEPVADFEQVLDFWFGPLDLNGRADPGKAQRWFAAAPEFDDLIRQDFSAIRSAAQRGELDLWQQSPRGRLALIVVLDQFSRNIFRGTPEMFTGDTRALELALQGISQGDDRDLSLDQRWFFYMPLMHSESLPVQDQCVQLFAALVAEAAPTERDGLLRALQFAERHREIIARFGRFPHRNATLDRTSTAAEINFLKGPDSSF